MSESQNLEEVVKTASSADLSVISLISSADLIGKLVMLILLFASVWSWAIIVSKYMKYRNVQSRLNKFEKLFWSGQVLDDLFEKVKQNIDNPFSSVFVSAMEEFKRRKNYSTNTERSDALRIGQKERIYQAMQLTKNRELNSLETNLSFLAIVGSSATFIGLFGTVWGIMHSFQSIAASKNTSLAVVAPGIAEALLATAIGLFAAIPASMFYNYFANEMDNITNRVDDFIGELNKLLSRAIDEGNN